MSGPNYQSPQYKPSTNLYGQPVGGYPSSQSSSYPVYQPAYSTGLYSGSGPEKRSQTMGVTSFILVVLAAVGFCVGMWMFGGELIKGYHAVGDPLLTSEQYEKTPEFEEAIDRGIPWFITAMVSAVVGLIGWIVSIVALALQRGTGWALGALVLGIIAPVLGLGLAMSQVWPIPV